MYKNAFTTKETLILSGMNKRKLDYLMLHNVIKPSGKLDEKSNYFTWAQIQELKIIARLRESKVSIKTIKEAKDKLISLGYDDNSLSNKAIIATNKSIAIVPNNDAEIGVIITGKLLGQTILAKMLWDDLRNEIYETAKRNNIVNFERRLDEIGVKSHRIMKYKNKELSVV